MKHKPQDTGQFIALQLYILFAMHLTLFFIREIHHFIGCANRTRLTFAVTTIKYFKSRSICILKQEFGKMQDFDEDLLDRALPRNLHCLLYVQIRFVAHVYSCVQRNKRETDPSSVNASEILSRFVTTTSLKGALTR